MQQQMEMFKKGGLKDEGGTKDPVSGNDVPSGSLKEEVRDDIDAKLSPGEFVFPADVVRFIGLQKLMQMRDKAKAGLQRMEDMGQMGNSDEAIIDDDVPFGTTDLIIMAGPSDNEMNQGGMPTQQQQSNQAGGVPGQGRFNQIVGQPQFNYEVKKFRNEAGAELFIPFVGNNPVYQAPPGYTEVTQEQQQQELADPTLPQATVESELGKSGVELDTGMGDTVAGVGYSEMTDTEKADFGDEARGVGPSGAFGKGAIAFGSGFLDMTGGMISAGPLGKAAEYGVEAITGEKGASKTLSAIKNDQIEDAISRSKARELMSPRDRARQRARDTQTAADRGVGQMEDAYGAPPGTFGIGVSVNNQSYAVDLQTNTVYGLDDYSSRVGKEKQDAIDAAKAKEKDEAQKSDPAETGIPDPQVGEPSEAGMSGGKGSGSTGTGGMGGGPQSAGEAGGAPGESAVGGEEGQQSDDTGPSPETDTVGIATGGLIPKRKRKKKKKRSGLASR